MPRVFLAQALVTNGISVGGTSSIAFEASYANVVASEPDGAIGAEDVDRAGLGVAVTLETTDVTKANAILDAAVGNTTFSGQEAGGSLYQAVTVPGIVWNSMRIALNDSADGRLTLSGRVRFATGTTDLDGIIAAVGGQAAPTLVYPVRLYRPHNASFNPGVAIVPVHVKSLNLSVSAALTTGFGDADIGETAVDRSGFGALEVALTLKDTKIVAPSDQASALMKAARGVLTCDALGRGGAALQTATINNLLWTSVSKRKGKEYWEYTINGRCGWRATAGTAYTVNGASKLWSFA